MKKKRQYRSNQGRSPRQQESSLKIVWYASWVLILMLTALIVENLIEYGI